MIKESLNKLFLFSRGEGQADGKAKQHITAYICNCLLKEFFQNRQVFRNIGHVNNEIADATATTHIRVTLWATL